MIGSPSSKSSKELKVSPPRHFYFFLPDCSQSYSLHKQHPGVSINSNDTFKAKLAPLGTFTYRTVANHILCINNTPGCQLILNTFKSCRFGCRFGGT